MKSQPRGKIPSPMGMVVWLFLVLWLVQACGRPREVALDEAPPRGEAIGEAVPEAREPLDEIVMLLHSRQSSTEYSPRPEPFTPPISLNEVEEPAAGSWEIVQPGQERNFYQYDHIRVREQGEAVLDLGDFMHLLLRSEAVIQPGDGQLAVEKWDEIRIEAVDTPALQELLLNLYLMRGGFSGKLDPGGGPVALSTPNAIVIVSGTSFFIAYDPGEGRTWVGNLEGTIHVGDVPADEKVGLDGRRMITIPPFQGQRYFDLPPDLDEESFALLAGLTGSPIDAAVAFTGPLLRVGAGAGQLIWSEPSQESERLGVLPGGAFAPVLGHVTARDGGYWEIVCPTGISGRPGCFVSDNEFAVTVYNSPDAPREISSADRDADGVFDVDDLCLDEPAGASPHPDRPGCPAVDSDGDGWFDHEDACWDVSSGAFPDPGRPGCPAVDSDGDGLFDYEDACRDLSSGNRPDPAQPGCPIGDFDGDGWLDDEDRCVAEPEGSFPDPGNPGCPAVDSDGDGLFDYEDVCWDVSSGAFPDPNYPGCPAADSDGDGWFDYEDECWDESSGQFPDPDHPGCPIGDFDGDGWPDNEDQCLDEPEGSFPDPDNPGCPAVDSDGDGWFDYEDECVDVPSGGSPDPDNPGCPAPKNSSILVLVYWDLNEDGNHDSGEHPLSAVAQLRRDSCSGKLLDTESTFLGGAKFSDLAEGVYCVSVIDDSVVIGGSCDPEPVVYNYKVYYLPEDDDLEDLTWGFPYRCRDTID